MQLTVLGWAGDDVTVDLDHRKFAYAGKFVMTHTGKAVARENDRIVAAAAFDADRTNEAVCRIRYITVRADRRGEGVGSTLLRYVGDRVLDRNYESVRIAVNNPYAYWAAYRAGFGYTEESTGVAELVLARPPPDSTAFQIGMKNFVERELSDAEEAFVTKKIEAGPPSVLEIASQLD